jgi:taurine dioxygenase
MTSHIPYRALEPFGIEVLIDPRSGLSADEQAQLVHLYDADGLVLFRGLQLSMHEQTELCSLFGPTLPADHVESYIVSNTRPDGLLGNQELLFHNDVPFIPAPYLGASLHAVEVDEGVSGTRFASGYLAYEHLPQRLRERIAGLHGLHVRKRVDLRRTRLTDLQPGDVASVHPVVPAHSSTDRPFLFVSEDMTGCIIGMTDHESDLLLDELFSYLYQENTIYEHAWQPGDLIVWDNLAIQHARHATTTGTRTLQRVTIAELGRYDQVPTDLASFKELRTANRGAAWGSADGAGSARRT